MLLCIGYDDYTSWINGRSRRERPAPSEALRLLRNPGECAFFLPPNARVTHTQDLNADIMCRKRCSEEPSRTLAAGGLILQLSMDVHVKAAITAGVRRRAIDAVTAQEDGATRPLRLPGSNRVPRRARSADELERRPGEQKLIDFFLRQHIQVEVFEVADATPDDQVHVAIGKRLRRGFRRIHRL